MHFLGLHVYKNFQFNFCIWRTILATFDQHTGLPHDHVTHLFPFTTAYLRTIVTWLITINGTNMVLITYNNTIKTENAELAGRSQ